MNLNLSQFKKVKEDDKSAVLKHPQGHHITIAKNALSPKLKSQLSELPMHYDEGGEAPQGPIKQNLETGNPLVYPPWGQESYRRNQSISVNPYGGKTDSEIEKSQKSAKEKLSNYKSIGLYDVGGVVPGNSDNLQKPEDQPAEPQKQSNQPTIIINNGQPQQPQNPNYVSNGNFDLNRFILDNPQAPLESKTRVLESQNQENMNQEKGAQAAVQQQKAQIDAYNAAAQKAGLPIKDYSPEIQNAIQSQPAQIQPAIVTNQAQTPQMPQAPSDPFGTQAYEEAYGKGLQEQKMGIAQEAQASGEEGRKQAEILGQQIPQQQQALKSYQDHYGDLDKERNNFISDIQNQHVDPKHYLNSMGTGQKVRTAIGLILGGIGGGLLHQENPVLKYLNNQIENDINAQKANLGKSENLLNANMRQFGNLRDASDMTRVMQSDIVSNQLKQEAAKAQDPLAKSRALQLAGQLDQQSAQVVSQIAMKKALLGGMQSGNLNPASAVRMLVPEKQQEQAFKELGESQERVKGKDNALRAFDELIKINSVGNRILSPLQSSRSVNSTRNILAVGLARATAGRVNEYEFEAAKDLYPMPGDDDKTIALKRRNLVNLVQEKMNTPILSAYGINVGSVAPGGRYNESGQKKIQLGAPVPQQQNQNNINLAGR